MTSTSIARKTVIPERHYHFTRKEVIHYYITVSEWELEEAGINLNASEEHILSDALNAIGEDLEERAERYGDVQSNTWTLDVDGPTNRDGEFTISESDIRHAIATASCEADTFAKIRELPAYVAAVRHIENARKGQSA
jgi:hypothetical protein